MGAQTVPRFQDLRNLPVIDARRYGLRADGVTNDKVALDAAWNAACAMPNGAIVELPDTSIYLSSTWLPAAPGAGKTCGLFSPGKCTIKGDTTNAQMAYNIFFVGTSASVRYLGGIHLTNIACDNSAWGLDGVNRSNSGTLVAADSYKVAFTATGGTFTLTFNGATTAALAYNASTATIQTALEGLASVGAGNVLVTGSAGAYFIEFAATLNNTLLPFSGSGASLTGSGAVASFTIYGVVTLGSAASAVDDAYNNLQFCIVYDSVNSRAVSQIVSVADYIGASKKAVVTAWASGLCPSVNARYGIALSGTSSPPNQAVRGVGRIGFQFCDKVTLSSIDFTGGFGAMDWRGTNNVILDGFRAEDVTENALNGLSGTDDVTDPNCKYYTMNNIVLRRCGEGIDAAFDYLTLTNFCIEVSGEGDEGIDANTLHYSTISNGVIIGGNHGINHHGVAISTKPSESTYDVHYTNVHCRDFVTGGVGMLYSSPDGTEQALCHGQVHGLHFTDCSFISSVAGAVGMELSGTSAGSFPIYIDDVDVSQCYIDVPGTAIIAHMSRRLTVEQSHIYSSGSFGFYAANATYFSTDVRVKGCWLKGVGTSTTGGPVNLSNSIRPIIQGNTIVGTVTAGIGIGVQNCQDPIVDNNVILGAHHNGIQVGWSVATNIAADNELKVKITNNRVYDWGSALSGRTAILLNLALTSGSVAYSAFDISGNECYLPTVAINSHLGINVVVNAGGTNTLSGGMLTRNYVTPLIATYINRINLTDTDLLHPIQCSANIPGIDFIQPVPSTASLTIAQSGCTFSNAGASASVAALLPAAKKGMKYTFLVQVAQQFRVDTTSDFLPVPSTGILGAAGKYIYSDSIGASVTIECSVDTFWNVVAFSGPWWIEGTGATTFKTADFTIAATELFTTYVNTGAAGAVVGTLPAAVVGARTRFYVSTAQAFRAKPASGEKICLPSTGVPGAVDKYLGSSTVGNYVELECFIAGTWAIRAYSGAWVAEP